MLTTYDPTPFSPTPPPVFLRGESVHVKGKDFLRDCTENQTTKKNLFKSFLVLQEQMEASRKY